MMLRTLACFLFVTVSAAGAARWNVQFLFDENDRSLVIADLKFSSPKRGVAAGHIVEKGKQRGVVLVTNDGGEHWSQVPFKELPVSMFFVNDSMGWIVTEKGLWHTEESGRSWQKMKSFPKDILRVHFQTPEHGLAVGLKKQIFETNDGGQQWVPLPAAAEPKTNPENTTYGFVSFDGQDGMISGWSAPPRRRQEIPDWMDPGAAQNRREWPSTLVLLQTTDGGKSWKSSTSSVFGRLTRFSFGPKESSLGLIEFTDNFEWPCEVYRVGPGGKSDRVFRQPNRSITDVALTRRGVGYLAGSESTAAIRHSPIPGKLKILRSTDLSKWEEMPVDYRVEAHRVLLSVVDDENIWAATDTGAILKLQQ